jgi:hypothetical protein
MLIVTVSCDFNQEGSLSLNALKALSSRLIDVFDVRESPRERNWRHRQPVLDRQC